jgi:hypothetical protein
MPTISFTYALKRFFPGIKTVEVGGQTISQALEELEYKLPGIRSYILDDQGRLRQHVNIFLDGELIKDRENLGDQTIRESEVYIMQALSGG